ncbi:hypothetical protein [Mucilaginibacter sp. UYCu711]|uniref:hypothetical protein n=1 Tax=Mucilaginibacter sp. UYCu711 TaxID=3156339 RepID=UPI003D206EED
MLNAISWQQYSTALLLLSLLWYGYVGLRYYRAEIFAKLKIAPPVQTIVPAVAKVVMGEAKPETDTGLFDPDELIFSNSQPDDISDQTLPKGPANDLLAEAETLVAAFAETDNKSEFLSLLKLLIDKYDVYADEISLPAIISSLKTFAATKLPFTIQAAEWPLTFTS